MSHALWASSSLVLHGRQRRPLLRLPDPTAGLLSPVALHRGLSAGGLGAVRPGCPEPAQLGGGRPPALPDLQEAPGPRRRVAPPARASLEVLRVCGHFGAGLEVGNGQLPSRPEMAHASGFQIR